MDFLKILPLLNFEKKDFFASCKNLHEFLEKIISLSESSDDLRTQQACLSVYMAFRDHYPRYLKSIDPKRIENLNNLVATADPKVIKLRRIALAELSKVA